MIILDNGIMVSDDTLRQWFAEMATCPLSKVRWLAIGPNEPSSPMPAEEYKRNLADLIARMRKMYADAGKDAPKIAVVGPWEDISYAD